MALRNPNDDFAFPRTPVLESTATVGVWEHGQEGMTLRDWFAGQALGSLSMASDLKTVAEIAYQVADAMLEQRAKR